ncbi:MAG: hypothetical protein AAB441_01010 [Patescibacteria group bacterium]
MTKLYEYLTKMEMETQLKMVKKVNNLSIYKLFKVIFQCYLYSLDLEEMESRANFFDFAANETLSGVSYPCSYFPHKVQIVKDLINFCYLYSDTISLVNPLEFVYYYLKDKDIETQKEEDYFKIQCIENLHIILMLEEAIEEKRICFTKQNFSACSYHLKEINKKQIDTSNLLYKYGKKILKPYIKSQIKTLFEPPNTIIIEGLGNLFFEDKLSLTFDKFPKPLRNYIRKYKKVPNEFKIEYVAEKLLNEAVDSVMVNYGPVSKGYGRTFLTTNPLETMILNQLNAYGGNKSYSHNIVKGLNHLVPFIRNIELKKVIYIRKKEEESFERYRSSIRKVLKETENCKTQSEFEEALKDIVNPEVRKLENIFDSGQLNLLKINLKGAATCIINIGIGLSFNDPKMIAEGLSEGAKTVIESTIERYKLIKDVSKNNYYFLWKIKKESRPN